MIAGELERVCTKPTNCSSGSQHSASSPKAGAQMPQLFASGYVFYIDECKTIRMLYTRVSPHIHSRLAAR